MRRLLEGAEINAPGLRLLDQQQMGNQEAADDEKDLDSEAPAPQILAIRLEPFRIARGANGMGGQDHENGDGAQAVEGGKAI